MNEGSEVFVDNLVHMSNENGVLCLKEVMSWISPLLDCPSYERSSDDKWIVIGKLSCLGPALDVSR